MGFASNVTRGKHSINAYESYELRVIYVAVRAMRVRWSCDGRAMVVQRRYYFLAICITISAILRAESV